MYTSLQSFGPDGEDRKSEGDRKITLNKRNSHTHKKLSQPRCRLIRVVNECGNAEKPLNNRQRKS